MSKIIRYKVLENNNLRLLEDLVQDCLQLGWQPYGDLVVTPWGEEDRAYLDYYQPMVKYSGTQSIEQEGVLQARVKELGSVIERLIKDASPFVSPDIVDETCGTLPLMDALKDTIQYARDNKK